METTRLDALFWNEGIKFVIMFSISGHLCEYINNV